LIVGTLPPPRFSTGELYQEDVDFCYGSKHGLLWPILNELFDLGLLFENSQEAVQQRKYFLSRNQIGICDMVESCQRIKMNASDLGMAQIKLRDLSGIIEVNKEIHTLLLMGGNSKNGPEYLLRNHLKSRSIKLEPVSREYPKIHQFLIGTRKIRVVSLISPSSAANRSIGANPSYKMRKLKHPDYSTFDFRVDQYRRFFY
jgi:G:T/U-mismatch repair DNA glycosylase